MSHDKIGDVRVAQGDLPGALAAYEAGHAIAKRLAEQDPGNAGWQRDLIVSRVKIARVAELKDAPREAQRHYQAALDVAIALRDGGRLAPRDIPMIGELERRLAALAERTAGPR